jgi:hypothetical protein
MKAFRFSLDRVLAWWQTQFTLETAKLERLNADLRAAGHARDEVLRRRAEAQSAVGRSSVVRGSDLRVLETFRVWSIGEEFKLAAHVKKLECAIEEQHRTFAEARRRVRLIERLKERRREDWKAEFDQELEQLAGEFAISQWGRSDKRSL